MTMNCYIKHWFRLNAKDFPFCNNCKSLSDYIEETNAG